MKKYSLLEIAEKVQATIIGDTNVVILGAGTIQDGKAGEIGFLAESQYEKYLPHSHLSAIIVDSPREGISTTQLVVHDVKYAWREVAALFENQQHLSTGINMGASVDPSAKIGANVTIEAGAVIGAEAEIGDNCYISALAYVAPRVKIGCDGIIGAGARILPRTIIGKRVHILANAVIGERGFGFSLEQGHWQPIPQIGGVIIGDDVEIGACTTIDRGAVRDTIIGNRVKLDNQIQIGHNVIIGDDTIIAGATVIAGSVEFGRHCVVGGASVFAGHISICDGAQFAGHSSVSKSITQPGVYCSALTVMPDRQWKRFVAKLKIFGKEKNHGK